MVWGKSSDRDEHRERSEKLTAAYHGPAGLPMHDRSGVATGSRGGAPIWVMEEAFVPSPCTCGVDGPRTSERVECLRHGPREKLSRLMSKREKEGGRWGPREGPETPPYRKALAGGHDRGFSNGHEGADPDGFAVFGRYPKGFLAHVLSLQLLGDVARDDVLHVCSGTLGPDEKWSVDIRAEARPRVQASGTALPFRDASFAAVMLDPPYSDQYARNLYGTENPRPSWLLKEAARVVRPTGRVGILHVAVPFAPPGCRLVRVYGVSTGVGFRIRAFTIYEREQDSLFAPQPPRAAGTP